MVKLQFNSGHHISHVSATRLARISDRMDWWTVNLTGYHRKINCKTVSSQFAGLWLQTQNLGSFIKKACTFFWEGRRALASPGLISDSNIRISFYMGLYWKKKKRLGANVEEQLNILLGSLCSSLKVLQVLCLSEHSHKKNLTSFSNLSLFPLKSSSLLVRLGMCLSVLLFFSLLRIVKLNWILLRNNKFLNQRRSH